MTTVQEALMDYQPTADEEKVRLISLVAKLTAEREALQESPALTEFKKAETKAKKVAKEVESLGEKIAKAEKDLRKIDAITIEEPTENGFYLLTMSSVWTGHKKEVRTQIVEKLYIRVFSDWLDAEDGTWFKNERWNHDKDFSVWLGIDEDTVSAAFTKIENLDEMPAELKEEPFQSFGATESDDEAEDDE